MPVYHGKREVEVKWVRYGGIESDETLDIMTFFMFVEWDTERTPAGSTDIIYSQDKVNELTLMDFGMRLPSDSYIVLWDDKRESIDFTEYLSKAKYQFNPTEDFSFIKVIAKGHDFNSTYKRHKDWKYYDNKEYYPFVTYKKSTKPGITPERVLRVYGIAFKGNIELDINIIKNIICKEYIEFICKTVSDTEKSQIINSKLALIHNNYDNVKDIVKNLRIERGVN